MSKECNGATHNSSNKHFRHFRVLLNWPSSWKLLQLALGLGFYAPEAFLVVQPTVLILILYSASMLKGTPNTDVNQANHTLQFILS